MSYVSFHLCRVPLKIILIIQLYKWNKLKIAKWNFMIYNIGENYEKL